MANGLRKIVDEANYADANKVGIDESLKIKVGVRPV